MKHREDVLVIGGGVIGVCAAYYLLEEGRQVTILERDAVCSGSSYGNSGLIVPSHSIPLPVPGAATRALKWMLDPESPFYIRPRFSLDLFSWLWQFRAASTERRMRNSVRVLIELSQASIALYDELIAQEQIECNYHRRGLLILYKTARGYREGLREAQMIQEHGLKTEQMTGLEVHEMEPHVRSDIAGGVYHQGDAHLDPAKFVHGLASSVRELGGTIQEGVEVLGFETSGNRIVTVNTAQGAYHPEQVVLATGSWSPGLVRDLRLKLPVQPAKGYSVTFKRGRNSLTLPLLLSEAKVGVNPMGPVMRLAGTLEFSGLDLTINSRRVNAMIRAAGDYLLDGLESASAENAWSGLRPCTPDGLPVIGAASSLSNLVVATGHAMLGMTLGPITGKLVAQIVCRQVPTVDLAALSPDRFQ
jgi:D-amino-acid dehydrogenase